MKPDDADELRAMGLAAAREIAGPDAVQDLEVDLGYDPERVVYVFSFLIDQSRSRHRPGLLRARLSQRIHDGLIARSDDAFARLRMLDRPAWDRRRSA